MPTIPSSSHDAFPLRGQVSLVDAPSQAVFDRLTALATRALRIPVALVTLVDSERQVFRSRSVHAGPLADVYETPISHSLCRWVADHREPLVVPDTREDPRTCDNPAVTDLHIVAYAGMPLFDSQGHSLGAFCVIDHEPRHWTDADLEILRTLAMQVMSEIALRASLDRLGLEHDALRKAEAHRAQTSRADRHDLRTPLQAMLLGVQAVRQLGEVNADQAECLALAERNGQVLVAMVDKLLDIGNIDDRGSAALSRQDCLPSRMLAAAIEQVAALAADKRVRLRSDVSAVTPVRADADKVVRVLVNLLGNAVKFTPAGGEVCVDVAPGEEKSAASGETVFSIHDTGVGIEPEHLGRLFKEGYRVDNGASTRHSTGLGLAFCQRVVQAHGGRIWVQSKPGAGSRFAFTLPTA